MNEKYAVSQRLYAAIGEGMFHLDVFGDELAKRKGWRGIGGMEAIYLYLVQKHNWTPATVRSMNHEDLRLALHEEMQDWTLPKEARG